MCGGRSFLENQWRDLCQTEDTPAAVESGNGSLGSTGACWELSNLFRILRLLHFACRKKSIFFVLAFSILTSNMSHTLFCSVTLSLGFKKDSSFFWLGLCATSRFNTSGFYPIFLPTMTCSSLAFLSQLGASLDCYLFFNTLAQPSPVSTLSPDGSAYRVDLLLPSALPAPNLEPSTDLNTSDSFLL